MKVRQPIPYTGLNIKKSYTGLRVRWCVISFPAIMKTTGISTPMRPSRKAAIMAFPTGISTKAEVTSAVPGKEIDTDIDSHEVMTRRIAPESHKQWIGRDKTNWPKHNGPNNRLSRGSSLDRVERLAKDLVAGPWGWEKGRRAAKCSRRVQGECRQRDHELLTRRALKSIAVSCWVSNVWMWGKKMGKRSEKSMAKGVCLNRNRTVLNRARKKQSESDEMREVNTINWKKWGWDTMEWV